MFSVCEMTALCIRRRISPPRAPNSSFITSSTSLDHPPRTSMMMSYCRMSYPGNCCLSSQRRGPYLVVFSSCFVSLFSVHGQLISNARTLFSSWSINLASTLFCLTCSLTAKTGMSQYAWASGDSYLGLGTSGEYHGGTESESWSSLSISQNKTLRAALWRAKARYLFCASAEQLVSTWGILSAVLPQNLQRVSLGWGKRVLHAW